MSLSIKSVSLAVAAAASVFFTLSPASAMTAPAPQAPAASVQSDVVTEGSGEPILVKPAAMTTEEWYSVNPHHGMTLGQQAQYYKNGLRIRAVLADLKDSPGAQNTIVFAGKHYGYNNWQELRDLLRTNDYYMLTGLRQWYDKSSTNDNYLTASPNWLKSVSTRVGGVPVPVTDPNQYHVSIGYNPNYFSSVEEQTTWLSDKIVNREPFPSPLSKPYNDYEVVAAGLYMYSDGTSPAPLTGGWEESWARVVPTDFDPSQGTSPYHPNR